MFHRTSRRRSRDPCRETTASGGRRRGASPASLRGSDAGAVLAAEKGALELAAGPGGLEETSPAQDGRGRGPAFESCGVGLVLQAHVEPAPPTEVARGEGLVLGNDHVEVDLDAVLFFDRADGLDPLGCVLFFEDGDQLLEVRGKRGGRAWHQNPCGAPSRLTMLRGRLPANIVRPTAWPIEDMPGGSAASATFGVMGRGLMKPPPSAGVGGWKPPSPPPRFSSSGSAMMPSDPPP